MVIHSESVHKDEILVGTEKDEVSSKEIANELAELYYALTGSNGAADCLKPCEFVNKLMGKLVQISKLPLQSELIEAIFKELRGRSGLNWRIEYVQNACMTAEELMEEDAMKLILRTWNDVSVAPPPILSVEDRMRHLERVLVSIPHAFKLKHMDSDGNVFKYYSNYEYLVRGEIQLLTELEADIWNKLWKTTQMKDLTFAHVGCGFPLTGIMLHILSGGAQVTLIDQNEELVQATKQLLQILEEQQVVGVGAIKVVCAHSSEVEFSSGSMKATSGARLILAADVVDIASSISCDTTAQIMKDCSVSVGAIRKRNVQGLSTLLYQRYQPDAEGAFKKISSVVPPKDHMSRNGHDRVVGILHTSNVCCCDLFINTRSLPPDNAAIRKTLAGPVVEVSHASEKSINFPPAHGK